MLNFKSVNVTSAVIFIVLLVISLIEPISIWWFVALFFVWFTLTAFGSGLVSWKYYINILNVSATKNLNHVSITFDDGPHPDFTPKVLELLKKHNAKATFFCIGKEIESNPTLFKQILREGHTIGNHSYTHAHNFGFFNTEKVQKELEKTNNIIYQLTQHQVKLFRPPFGVTNPNIARAVKRLNFTTIGWNKRSLDTTSLSESKILKRATKNLKPGDVILLHDTSEKSVRVLERLLLFLQANNLQSVTVDTLFNTQAYA
ncbi:polysaccharide deacetylase family protein [Bizionia sp. KMM 8389]